jgi:hypothetical protein
MYNASTSPKGDPFRRWGRSGVPPSTRFIMTCGYLRVANTLAPPCVRDRAKALLHKVCWVNFRLEFLQYVQH